MHVYNQYLYSSQPSSLSYYAAHNHSLMIVNCSQKSSISPIFLMNSIQYLLFSICKNLALNFSVSSLMVTYILILYVFYDSSYSIPLFYKHRIILAYIESMFPYVNISVFLFTQSIYFSMTFGLGISLSNSRLSLQ